MRELNDIIENEFISNLVSIFRRSPKQLNKLQETDAEIIQLNENTSIAVTTDAIAEEISVGLYDDPYQIGWMIVTVNVSDLAAVGALPLGILISEIIPPNFSDEKLNELQKGISDACNAYNTFVVGGDTNEGKNLVLTGTAFGIVNNQKHLSRVGCKPDDILYSTGELGLGNAYAISKLISKSKSNFNYKPHAQLFNLGLVSKYASCSMDTSDGLITTLDQLMRLNNVGFKLSSDWQKAIDRHSLRYIESLRIPGWLLFAGQHGEFQLIFTIPKELNNIFFEEAYNAGFHPIELGSVMPDEQVLLPLYQQLKPINTTFIRNLPNKAKGDINHYLKLLLEYDYELKNKLA